MLVYAGRRQWPIPRQAIRQRARLLQQKRLHLQAAGLRKNGNLKVLQDGARTHSILLPELQQLARIASGHAFHCNHACRGFYCRQFFSIGQIARHPTTRNQYMHFRSGNPERHQHIQTSRTTVRPVVQIYRPLGDELTLHTELAIFDILCAPWPRIDDNGCSWRLIDGGEMLQRMRPPISEHMVRWESVRELHHEASGIRFSFHDKKDVFLPLSDFSYAQRQDIKRVIGLHISEQNITAHAFTPVGWHDEPEAETGEAAVLENEHGIGEGDASTHERMSGIDGSATEMR